MYVKSRKCCISHIFRLLLSFAFPVCIYMPLLHFNGFYKFINALHLNPHMPPGMHVPENFRLCARRNMNINLCGLDRTVSEYLLDTDDIHLFLTSVKEPSRWYVPLRKWIRSSLTGGASHWHMSFKVFKIRSTVFATLDFWYGLISSKISFRTVSSSISPSRS